MPLHSPPPPPYRYSQIGALRWWEDTVYGYLNVRLMKPVTEPQSPYGQTTETPPSHRILGYDSVIFNIEVILLCVFYVCTYGWMDVWMDR